MVMVLQDYSLFFHFTTVWPYYTTLRGILSYNNRPVIRYQSQLYLFFYIGHYNAFLTSKPGARFSSAIHNTITLISFLISKPHH